MVSALSGGVSPSAVGRLSGDTYRGSDAAPADSERACVGDRVVEVGFSLTSPLRGLVDVRECRGGLDVLSQPELCSRPHEITCFIAQGGIDQFVRKEDAAS